MTDRLLGVVHAHLLAGAEWRLHDPQRPLTHDRLLYVIHRPFGRITSMPATGQLQPVTVAAEISIKQTLRLAAMPACGWTPSLRPNRGTCDLPSSGRADLESVGVLHTLHQGAAGCVVAP
ncbi:MAG TPA: hypothetical protein VGM03_09700, partial [Phycisphaerae bacterium]